MPLELNLILAVTALLSPSPVETPLPTRRMTEENLDDVAMIDQRIEEK